MSLTFRSAEEKELWERADKIRKDIRSISGRSALQKAMALLGETSEEKSIILMITELLSKPRFDEVHLSFWKNIGRDGFTAKNRSDSFESTEWKYALAKSFLFFREFGPIDQRIIEIWEEEGVIRAEQDSRA